MSLTTRQTVLERYATLTGRCASGATVRLDRNLERALRHTLGPGLPVARSARILEVGCGPGLLMQWLRREGYLSLHGFDVSPENVDLCRRAGLTEVVVGDVTRMDPLPWPAGWDCILCWDVLEHVPAEQAVSVLSGLREQLAPGGRLLIQTPNMGSLFAVFYRYNDLTHETGYTETTLRIVLEAAGFQEIEIGPAWRRVTWAGRVRELCLRLAHRGFWALHGRGAPRIASPNLLARAGEREL